MERSLQVEFRRVEDALMVLGEASVDARTQAAAYQYLVSIDPSIEIPQLVEALCSDKFKVRWEAAKRLSELGRPAVKEMLSALTDPQRVGEPCLRDGVYHVLHIHRDPAVRQLTAHLLNDLHGSAADLKTMHEAHHLLREFA
jgi:HEAT repeat protein